MSRRRTKIIRNKYGNEHEVEYNLNDPNNVRITPSAAPASSANAPSANPPPTAKTTPNNVVPSEGGYKRRVKRHTRRKRSTRRKCHTRR